MGFWRGLGCVLGYLQSGAKLRNTAVGQLRKGGKLLPCHPVYDTSSVRQSSGSPSLSHIYRRRWRCCDVILAPLLWSGRAALCTDAHAVFVCRRRAARAESDACRQAPTRATTWWAWRRRRAGGRAGRRTGGRAWRTASSVDIPEPGPVGTLPGDGAVSLEDAVYVLAVCAGPVGRGAPRPGHPRQRVLGRHRDDGLVVTHGLAVEASLA